MAAMSAAAQSQDPADTGSTAADFLCACSTTGSTVAAPPELRSRSGVLEVTFKFVGATDAQGLVRYRYGTDTGLESPTLRVSPGDPLIIHLQNQLPATAAAAMADITMTLSSGENGCNGKAMSADATNIHFHGIYVAPVCGQHEVVKRLVQPGQSFDYEVRSPATEPPGLYWYHPHVHVSSEGQVQAAPPARIL